MELSEAIHKRRSIRKFLDKDISEKHLKKIIDSANWSPSACDLQGWRFIIIRDKEFKKKLINLGSASFIINAPVGILVLYDNRTDNVEYRDDIQSASAAIQNMILTAWSLGIGCCWVCHLPLKKKLRKTFGIPKIYDPIAYITMGYFKEKSKLRERHFPVEKIISYNRFDFLVSAKSIFLLNIKRLCRRIYYHLPFMKFIKPFIDKKFEKKFD